MSESRWLPLVACLLTVIFARLPVLAQSPAGEDTCLTAVAGFEPIARIQRGAVSDLEVSPDGSLLAVASSRGVWLYDAETLELESPLLLPAETGVTSISWSPDGRALVAGYADGLRIWNIERGEVIWWYAHVTDVTHVAWSPSAYRLAVLNTGFIEHGMESIVYSDLRILEPYSDFVLGRWTDIRGNIDQAFWLSDGSRLVYLNHVSGFSFGDTDAGYVTPTVLPFVWSEGEPGQVNAPQVLVDDDPLPSRSAAWSPDGSQLALDVYDPGTGSGEVQIRDSISGAIIRALPAGADPVWSADGSHFATYQDTEERGFRIWDGELQTGQLIPAPQTQQFVLSPDGSRLYASQWGTLAAYDTAGGGMVASLDMHPYRQLEAAWSPDSTLLATRYGEDSTGNTSVFIWNAAGELLQRVTTTGNVNSFYWSPGGQSLALLKSNAVEIHPLSADPPLVIEADDPHRLAWSPNGTQAAVILLSGDVFVWDAGTGEVMENVPSPVDNLDGTANSGDSRIVWTAETGLRWLIRDWDGLTRIYSLEQSEPVADLGTLDFAITANAAGTPRFLPDGRLFYTLRNGPTSLYDVDAGEVVETFRLRAEIARVWPSDDLSCYATSGSGMDELGQNRDFLFVYELREGTELNRLPLPAAPENTFRSGAAAWSPDGTRVALILSDGTLLLWGLPSESE